MKLRNGFWVDENKNKWDIESYSKEDALKHSATLIDCTYCTNCIDCRGCRKCTGCIDCIDCRGCRKCTGCIDCIDCRGCIWCTSCNCCIGCDFSRDCSNCIDCNYCNECNECKDCKDCNAFYKNPERIISYRIGYDYPAVYWIEVGKEQCIVGCFHGTLDEFEKAVEKTYKNNGKYLNEYKNFITKVRTYQGVIK